MLTDLSVTDLGVIDHVEVEFRPGSTALTGETGAGKTLVVAALGLLLGERADRSLVRAGAERARIEGRWEIPPEHPAVGILSDLGLVSEPSSGPVEVIVSRTIDAGGGSSRCRMNGSLVPVKAASEVCGELIEISGQHLSRSIGHPKWQRGLLDRFAGNEAVALASRVAEDVREARSADRSLAELRASAQERKREMDLLRYEIGEIEDADIQEGEFDRLKADLSRLENVEELAAALARASGRLEAESGVIAALTDVEQTLLGVSSFDPDLEPLTVRLESARYELDDIARELKARIMTPDEPALEEARERYAAIARLLRKYGASERHVLDHLSGSRSRLETLEGGDDRTSDLEARSITLWDSARSASARLSELRRGAAESLERAVSARLEELAMGDARFVVQIDDQDLTESGAESITFLLSANPGEPPKALNKAASGGELSRTALALQLVATGSGETSEGSRVMVFDEVDAGVGGAAARAVGRCLAELGSRRKDQVIVVTHLPQVASCTDHHLKVSKGTTGSVTRASVETLSDEDRVEEISRMLAGLPESERAQEHARELLEERVS